MPRLKLNKTESSASSDSNHPLLSENSSPDLNGKLRANNKPQTPPSEPTSTPSDPRISNPYDNNKPASPPAKKPLLPPTKNKPMPPAASNKPVSPPVKSSDSQPAKPPAAAKPSLPLPPPKEKISPILSVAETMSKPDLDKKNNEMVYEPALTKPSDFRKNLKQQQNAQQQDDKPAPAPKPKAAVQPPAKPAVKAKPSNPLIVGKPKGGLPPPPPPPATSKPGKVHRPITTPTEDVYQPVGVQTIT